MKLALLLLTIGLTSGVIGQNVTKIERFLYDKCRTYATDASAFDQIKKELSDLTDYLKYTTILLPNGKEQFCNDEKIRLIGLMKKLAQDLHRCMPKAEKYLPKFLHESFTDFLNFVCSGNTIENYFSTQGADCRSALKEQHAGEEVGMCFQKLFTSFDSSVQKEDLCLDLKLAKTCFGDALTRYCPNFAGYIALNNKFFDAIRKPCDGATSTIASVTLLTLALFFTKMFR